MKNLLSGIEAAIKSRKGYNKTLTDQQKKRLVVCSGCTWNSKNQQKRTLRTIMLIIINKLLDKCFGIEDNEESICTKCGCNLKHKTSQEGQSCPEKKWK